MQIIYFLVALFATTLGALAGLGGGVIIKPVLDALKYHDLFAVGILSSVTVFTMAVVSTYKQYRNGFVFTKTLILLAIGAVVGGILGNNIFSLATASLPSDNVKVIQAAILAVILCVVFFKHKLPTLHIKSSVISILTGLLLGGLSAFLGIGGGPINVAFLCILFSMNIKEAAVGSIFIILLAQFSKLMTVTFTTGFGNYDYSFLFFMVPAAILGGLIGASLNKKLKSETIHVLFQFMLVAIVALNIYNILTVVLS